MRHMAGLGWAGQGAGLAGAASLGKNGRCAAFGIQMHSAPP